ncbi:MAG: hypothetical protein IJL21_03635 [Alphaproteobacteria bacterium]|nr:hypothetical protein [Alphaproteobacteria bacterium]
MNKTIVFISPKFGPDTRERIMKALNMPDAVITDNIEYATIVITPHTAKISMTMYEFALKQIEKAKQELNTLVYMLRDTDKFYIQPLPQLNKKHTMPPQQRALNRFTRTQKTYRQRIFNRTKCK